MNKVIDFLASVMTAATLCCLVRYIIYPGLRIIVRSIVGIMRLVGTFLRRQEEEPASVQRIEAQAIVVQGTPLPPLLNHD